MIVNILIEKYTYYIILSYILTICGIVINCFFHIDNPNLFSILYFLTLLICFFNILLIKIIKIDNETKKEYMEIGFLKWNYVKPLKKGSKEKSIEFLKIVKLLTLIIIPIITGCYCYAIYIPTSPSYLKLISIAFEMTLIYTVGIRGEIFQKDYRLSSIYTVFLVVSLIIISQPLGLNLLNMLLNYIIDNWANAFTILIAIIMLCVGLSALSFSYCSILKDNSKTRKNMRKNGEEFFIASILSMIAIFLLFIASISKKYVVFMVVSNLNILSFDFIILNIYSVFVIIIFTFTVYASYCMLKCSILSLKELKLIEDNI